MKWLYVSIFCLFLAAFSVLADEECFDRDERCGQLSVYGDCKNDQSLRRKCAQTCGVCRTADENDILQSIQTSAAHTIILIYIFAVFAVCAVFVTCIKLRNTGGMCLSKGSMKDKLVVITGATSGIGLDTAFHLALRGAKIVIGCRNLKQGFKVAKDLRNQTGQKMIEVRKLDLASLDSIRDFATMVTEQYVKVDVLINNAGIYSGRKRTATEDGYESTFQTNYLGHFYLTKLLMKKLKESVPSRVVNVVSDAFKKGELDFKNLQGTKNFNNLQAYRNSNLALMYFTKELEKVLKDSGVTVNAANPGVSATNLWRNIIPYNWNLTWFFLTPYSYLYWKSSSMGAETAYFCALDQDLVTTTGKYFEDCKEEPFPELEDTVGRKLWAVSERLLESKKLSTLNQAAIKKALNGIAEAEAAKDKEKNGGTTTAPDNTGTDSTDGLGLYTLNKTQRKNMKESSLKKRKSVDKDKDAKSTASSKDTKSTDKGAKPTSSREVKSNNKNAKPTSSRDRKSIDKGEKSTDKEPKSTSSKDAKYANKDAKSNVIDAKSTEKITTKDSKSNTKERKSIDKGKTKKE